MPQLRLGSTRRGTIKPKLALFSPRQERDTLTPPRERRAADASAALDYLRAHRADALQDLLEWLAIPSISSLDQHRADVRRAADWLAGRMARAGIGSVQVHATAGHPVVTGRADAGPDRPTLLVYGHYDVQPVEPLDAWISPPFAPEVRDGCVYGRGASDDKGQVLLQVLAAEAWLKTGGVPVNLVFLFEGEEESGSVHLQQFIAQHQSLLAADAAVISDTPMLGPGLPAICYGLRGLAALRVSVAGPRQDLHSGVYGGAVENPAHVLAALVASLHHPDGRVAVEGFYDGVHSLSAEEATALRALPFDRDAYLEATGSPALHGEPGFSTWERVWTRPTLDVNGMWAGHIGAGRKTVIPSAAHASLSCRLVPHQDPAHVLSRVEAHLRARCPDTVRLDVVLEGGDRAIVTPLDHPLVGAARRAIGATYGVEPVNIRMGGSVPAAAAFATELRAPTLLLGFALPDENFHAPNERFLIENFERGAQAVVRLWADPA
jgi:acetylornithine deacetylase/succinyl-diaminopimelate desuccinylase-like protein